MSEKHQRVLLVDDYPDALEIWSLYLAMCGYDVQTAEDGKTALEWALVERPDIIVMDLELPGLTGFEVARRLRAQPETRAIPMIAATGYSHAHQLDEARRAGFDVIVVKPCDPSVIVAEIERLLSDPEPSSARRQPSAVFGQSASHLR